MNRRTFVPQWCWALRVTAVILGLFAVVAAYFWAHKPFDADVVAGLGRSLIGVVTWLGINWLGAALGRLVSGELLLEERPSTRLALSAGIGLGLVSLLMLGLGLVGCMRPGVAWGLVLVLGILLWRDLWATLTDLRLVRLPRPASGFQCWLMVYGGVSLLLIIWVALAPPTGWDTLVCHLTGPRVFVEAGRIIHPIDLPYLGFPQLGEMQITLGLLLVGDRVAPLLHSTLLVFSAPVTFIPAGSERGRCNGVAMAGLVSGLHSPLSSPRWSFLWLPGWCCGRWGSVAGGFWEACWREGLVCC